MYVSLLTVLSFMQGHRFSQLTPFQTVYVGKNDYTSRLDLNNFFRKIEHLTKRYGKSISGNEVTRFLHRDEICLFSSYDTITSDTRFLHPSDIGKLQLLVQYYRGFEKHTSLI